MSDPVFVYAILAMLVGILWLGAIDKLRNMLLFEAAVAGYKLLPSSIQKPFAYAFVCVELLAGLLLLVPEWRALGAIGALAVFLVATLGMTVNLLRGNTDIDCGCGGLSQSSTGLSWLIVARNVVLAAFVLFVMTQANSPLREIVWFDWVSFIGFALAMLGLYFVLNQLIESHIQIEKIRSQS